MANKRHKNHDSSKQSIQERVLEKSRNIVDKQTNSTSSVVTQESPEVSDGSQIVPEVSEQLMSAADRLLKKVKRIKDNNRITAAKKRKLDKALSETKPKDIESSKSVNAVQYLRNWKLNKSEWKFNKNYQIWLFKNWSNPNHISDSDFELLIEYIIGLNSESLARKRIETDAQNIISKEELDFCYERARKVLQCIV